MTDKEAMQYLYLGIAQGIVSISDDYEHTCNYAKICNQCSCQPFYQHVSSTRLGNWEYGATSILMDHYSLVEYNKFKQDYPELLI